MSRQERLEIRLGNANQPVDAVRDQKPIGDPAPDTASRCIEGFGDLLDPVEFRRLRLIGLHFHHRPFPAPPGRHDLGGDDLLCRSPLRFDKSDRSCETGLAMWQMAKNRFRLAADSSLAECCLRTIRPKRLQRSAWMVEAGLINGEGGPCQAHRETAWTLHVQHPAANTGGMQKTCFGPGYAKLRPGNWGLVASAHSMAATSWGTILPRRRVG